MISKRLNAIASHIGLCETVLDIGCDHGLLDIYLIKHGIANHVIASDINQKPLERATENIAAENKNISSRITLRLSNGFENISCYDAQCAVLAGMGGLLMTDILHRGVDTVKVLDTLILQPNTDISEVRRFLYKIGYTIKAEEIVRDYGKFYTIINAVNSAKTNEPCYNFTEAEYITGRISTHINHAELIEYIYYLLAQNKAIITNIEANCAAADKKLVELYKLDSIYSEVLKNAQNREGN